MGTFNASPIVSAAAIAALKVIRTGDPHRQANAVAQKLRVGMQGVIDELDVDALVYGESSTFHVYFAKGARRCALSSISPAAIRGLSRDTLNQYSSGLRARGVDFMSFTGGVTSLAHQHSDVPVTLEAFRGTVKELADAGRVVRV